MRVAKVLVVVLIALVAACGNRDSGARDREPEVPPLAGLDKSCPSWDAPTRYAEGDLPEGATSVRLCPGPPIVAYDGTIYDVGIQPPEVLTTRVDDLVDVVNGLEPMPAEIACPSDGGPRLTYWFTYPDGDARAVTFENFGCQNLIVGQGVERAEGNVVARLFPEALLAQRAAMSPPAVSAIEAPDCRGVNAEPGTVLPHDPVDLASASLCVEAGAYRVRGAEVPAALMAELERGVLAQEVSWDGCVEPPRQFAVVLGYTT